MRAAELTSGRQGSVGSRPVRCIGIFVCSLAFTACSSQSVAPVARSTTPRAAAQSAMPRPTTTSPSAKPSPSRRQTVSGAQALGASKTVVRGKHGLTIFRLTLPVFSGPGADRVNARIRRSAYQGVTGNGGASDVVSEVDAAGVVTVNDDRTVQVRLPFVYYAQGAAHPTDSVSTVALQRVDGRPLLLPDVFSDLTHGLAVALRHATQVAAMQGQDDPSHLLTTKASDWANWQSGPTGMTFYFDDGAAGSHARGLRMIEVPWTLLRAYVRDDSYALLGPR